jgi:hypothetical protein
MVTQCIMVESMEEEVAHFMAIRKERERKRLGF